MCFSAAASLSSGTLLLVVGAVTVRMAGRGADRLYAAVPLLFAVQQLVEGVVWLSFDGPASLNFAAIQLYSFFSHVLWPVYVPLAAWWMEPPGPRRTLLSAFVALGFAVGGYLLYRLLVNPIEAHPVAGHVEYHSPHFYVAAAMTAYLLSTTVSLLVTSRPWVRAFGAMALASFLASYLFYARWFISVWCFFAALLSVAVALHFFAQRPVSLQGTPS